MKKIFNQADLVKIFWEAPPEALFGQNTIAAVLNISMKTLEYDRWKKRGIPYRKICSHILYQKIDLIEYIKSHTLIINENPILEI